MNTIEAKEKFSFNLLHPESKAFNTTVMFMVYKTIEANSGISFNRLKWLLNSELMLPVQIVEGTVATLTSRNLFNCVSRWQKPGSPEHVHLRPRDNADFTRWLDKAVTDYPELEIFNAPILANGPKPIAK